jgi:hypothetical protein
MTAVADYARMFELEIRPRRPLKRTLALIVWAGLYLVRPKLALEIWRERHGT